MDGPWPPCDQFDLEFAGFERGAVGPRERTQVYAERCAHGAADVEESGVRAVRTVLEHIVPPWVVLRCRHVVGHDVEKNSQSVAAGCLHEGIPCRLAAQIVADTAGIDDVIAMLAARNRLQAG